jgi:hypothetical protein
VNETPTVIEEAWLSGERPGTFTIVGIAPLGASPRSVSNGEPVEEPAFGEGGVGHRGLPSSRRG